MPSFGRKLLIYPVAFTLCFWAALSAQDSTAAAADSVAADTSSAAATAGDSTATSAATAKDSTAASPVAADSSAAPVSRVDTSGARPLPDSLKPGLQTTPSPAPPRRRPSGDEIEAAVIPWDWDDYTNVIEVGLKRIRDGREYSLTKNEEYQRLFDRFQGKKVRVWGQIRREGEGFYSLTINEFEPLDSLGAAANQPATGP
jgi:hypothetical protein